MPIQILLSKPAGGKTSFCNEKILRIRSRDPLAPIKVIVPDRMQMSWWKQALSRRSRSTRGSGFIGTQIISFSGLALDVLENTSGCPVLIPSRLDSQCVREAIRNASGEKPFAYFEPIREKPGLLSIFSETIRTLQHCCITPEMLENTAGSDPKAADTARVYRKYLDLLRQNNWIGSAGLLSTAAAVLTESRATFPNCPLLVIDGFDELPRDCLHLLKALSSFCDEILITLPADPDTDNPTDLRIRSNAEEIRKELNAEIVYPKEIPQTSEILRLADRVFFPNSSEIQPQAVLSDDVFLMIEASSRSTEIREALRELKRRIITNGIHPAECAIFVPDMNACAPILRQFGREMNIPLRFSQKQALAESPAASALKRLLQLAPDFDTVKVLSVLPLPFFSGCPDPNDSDGGNYGADLYTVDRIGKQMNVIGGISEWESAFSAAMKTAQETWGKEKAEKDESDEGTVYEYPKPEKLKRIRDSFLQFTALLTHTDEAQSRADWVKWLENLLETIHFYEQIEDRDGRSFESDFRTLLKRIVFCEEKLNLPAVIYEEFRNELAADLDAAVQTEQEFAGERVLVGDISQTSGCRWKLVILTGFAEETFPRPYHEELILTDTLRDQLGIPHSPDQQLLFRHAVTRSETGLIITRPQKTDKGEEWPPSIFWQTMRSHLEGSANLRTVSENTPVTAASPDEFTFRLARSGKRKVPETVPAGYDEKLQDMLDSAWDKLETLQKQARGEYSPATDPKLKAAISDPLRDSVPYSCSVIETWLTCPFRYFISKKLKLEPPQQPGTGMDAAQIGSLNHRVMELTFAPGTVYSSKEEALQRADRNIDTVFATAPTEFGFKESELWQYEKEKYRQKLLESIEKMFDAKKTSMPVNSHWRSVGAELKFGYPNENGSSKEPLTVETDAGAIQIRGIIDRVDQRDDGLLRVVDYKTGASGFGKEEIAAGSHIQAGVYAAAVVHALHMGPKCEGMYWSINYKQVKEYMLYDSENDNSLPNIQFLNKFSEGMRDASFPADPAGGTCPDYCPAASWCKKFVRRKIYG